MYSSINTTSIAKKAVLNSLHITQPLTHVTGLSTFSLSLYVLVECYWHINYLNQEPHQFISKLG